MINEQKLLKIITIIPIVSIIIFSIISIFGFYYTTSQNKRVELLEIKRDYINNQKEIIKNEIDTVQNHIKYKIDKLSNKLSTKQLQKEIMEDISNLRFGEDGYFYIYSYDGINLMHPIKPQLVGENLYNLKDKNGTLLIQELIKAAKYGGGYVSYFWDKPSTKQVTAKLGYSVGLDRWQWMIGTGVYLDDVTNVLIKKENKLEAQSFEILENFVLTSFIIMIIMSFILIKLMDKIKVIFLQYNKKLLNYQKDLEIDVKKKTKQIQDNNIELNYKLYHDNLTNILNRVSLQKHIKDNKGQIALAILDIKEFSKINNIYGESIGNEILKTFANVLSILFHEDKYIIFRISGDKFAILNQQPTNKENYKSTIKTKLNSFVKKSLEVVVDDQTLDIVIQCVIGISQGIASKKLIEHSDMALNYAKNQNKHIVIYSKNLHIEDKYKEDMRITQVVKDAIDENRVIPYFHAIIKDNKVSYECLVRIKNTDGTVMSPYTFLPIIMKTKYYSKITKIMIKKSFSYFQNTDIIFSINLSFEDISNNSTRKFIKEKIQQYDVSSQLILEILESESIDNFDLVRNFIEEMQSAGVKIAIDDFGSGYSNFTYLIELKPDFVKVDGSLIKNMDTDKNSYIMVKNITQFLHEMGIKTIAEFVHNQEIYDIVKSLKFNGIQGYFISEPLPDISDNSFKA